MVPNGKWFGKQLGDRYPGEEALTKVKEDRNYDVKDFNGHEGPGGRFYAYGQEDEDTQYIKHLSANQSSLAVQLGHILQLLSSLLYENSVSLKILQGCQLRINIKVTLGACFSQCLVQYFWTLMLMLVKVHPEHIY